MRARKPASPWTVLLTVGIGMVMVVIDVTILNVAMPTLVVELKASMAELEWALMGYTIMLTGMVPIFGRISDVLGRKRLFITGLMIFAGSSLLAGSAPSIGWLIGARVLQAVGGAIITANTLAIITDTFPAGRRGVAMGVQSILVSGGAALGPTLGGFLVTRFGWQAVFYVNVPVGMLAAFLAYLYLPPLRSNRVLEPLDWTGAASLMGGLTLFLIGVTKGGTWGWTAAPTLTLITIGLLALAFFVWWERRAAYPLVDLSLFRIRAITAGQLTSVFVTMAMGSMMFLFPFYWQGLRGFSALEAGMFMMPMPLTFMVVAPLAGRLSDVLGSRAIATSGLLVVTLALALLSRISAEMTVADVLWRFMVFGFGFAMFAPSNNNSVMSAAPADKRGISAGLLGMTRYLGQTLGVAFGGTLFAHMMSAAEGIPLAIGSEGMPSPETFEALAANPAAQQAFSNAFVQALSTVILAAIPLVLIGAVLSYLRGKGGGSEPVPVPARDEGRG